MVILSSDIEKELWRDAALKALGNIGDCNAKQDQEAVRFATMVADGVVLSYRKRCEKGQKAQDT